jgi:hypothetical protein
MDKKQNKKFRKRALFPIELFNRDRPVRAFNHCKCGPNSIFHEEHQEERSQLDELHYFAIYIHFWGRETILFVLDFLRFLV